MHVDTNVNPVAIYAGCDNGSFVYKSIDNGDTWIDLRELNPDMPFSVDYGVIYSGDGYRLLGGETSVNGGYSIIKTNDDETFYPVLGIGNSVYMVEELNGILFAGALTNGAYKTTSILVSTDNGETWKTAYTTMKTGSLGTSDGFRYMNKIKTSSNEDTIIVGCQTRLEFTQSPLRIVSNDSTYFAEIIVEVPDGCNEIIVESGYLCSNEYNIYNDSVITNEKMLQLSLNEITKGYVLDTVTGNLYKGKYEHDTCGKHLSSIYNYIVSPNMRNSIKIRSISNPFHVSGMSFGNYGFTISFIAKIDGITKFDIMPDMVFDTNKITYNGKSVIFEYHAPAYDSVDKYDFVVWFLANKIDVYKNGEKIGTIEDTTIASKYKFMNEFDVIGNVECNCNSTIQDFTIYKGLVSESELLNSYHAGLDDNFN